MTREEAYEVLGLRPGATEAEIRAAHHRLMRTAHPDSGGSDWLATRVNQARDMLLGRTGGRRTRDDPRGNVIRLASTLRWPVRCLTPHFRLPAMFAAAGLDIKGS